MYLKYQTSLSLPTVNSCISVLCMCLDLANYLKLNADIDSNTVNHKFCTLYVKQA